MKTTTARRDPGEGPQAAPSAGPRAVCKAGMHGRKRTSIDFDSGTITLLIRSGLHEVARRKRVSPRTIRRHFERIGQTVSNFVRCARRVLIPRLLEEGRSPSGVAMLVGFGSARSLSRFVRENYGMSTEELRAKILKKKASTG